jgi:hypothetical protein
VRIALVAVAVPTLVTVIAYTMVPPAVALAGPVFKICNNGAPIAITCVLMVLVQAAAGQVGSPPPETVAVFVSVVPLAAAVGVTGITKLTGIFVASPVAIVHVTCWPEEVHPLGMVPSAKLDGTLSVTVVAAVVAALPMLVTVSVYVAGVPTTKLVLLAVFCTLNCGASTGVFTVLEQFTAPGQVGSPPPETVAVFVSVVPLAAAVGVTGITKLTGVFVASPVAIVHVTC